MSFRAMGLDWWQGLGIGVGSAIALYANISIAQITPDRTLPKNSNVKLEGNTRIIEGGTTRGTNLFHSFGEFSVPNGSTAFFNNSPDIQNILTRVTGKSISNIDGLIRANGKANLFLLNPNGIIFGQNARLNIRGSFFATSANSMKFANGFEFSGKNPQSALLLTISVPIGLQFGANPGLIQVQGNGQGARDIDSPIIDTQDALRVQPDKILALVGGDINLEGATLKTAGGRIELSSIAGNGLVSLTATNKGFALGYDGVQNFGNIQLSQQANVDASGEGSGDINIETGRLSVSGDSGLYATTSGQGSAGSIKINADSELLLKDRAQVTVSSTSKSEAGNLIVNANSIRLDGRTKITADTTGGGGNIFINSPLLVLRNNSAITTNSAGANITGGNITIDAKNGFLVAVSKENSDIRADSANFRGGNVTINNVAGIFGFQYRKEPSPNTSDITATGATPVYTPEADPTRGLVELPINLVDASRQISNACTPGTRQFQNTFVATGRGGLPMSPTEPLQDSSTVSAWVKLRPKAENLANTTPVPQPTAVSTTPKIAATTPIVEASGWVVDRNGNIELVAQVPQVNPHSPWQIPASCPVSQ